MDVAFFADFGIAPPTGTTIRAADDDLWQALNDTPISTRSPAQRGVDAFRGPLINSCTMSLGVLGIGEHLPTRR